MLTEKQNVGPICLIESPGYALDKDGVPMLDVGGEGLGRARHRGAINRRHGEEKKRLGKPSRGGNTKGNALPRQSV